MLTRRVVVLTVAPLTGSRIVIVGGISGAVGDGVVGPRGPGG
jgi:hypothetical protein